MTNTSLVLGDLFFPKMAVRSRGLRITISAAIVVALTLATALSAQLKIEIGVIPRTLQTFVVLASGLLFGSRIGASSQLAYLLAGLAGIPWFSRGGGMSYVMSPTFGYLLGFVVAAYIVGKLAEAGFDKKFAGAILAMLAGSAIIYLFGLLWLSKFVPASGLMAVGFYPFLIGDLLKIVAAGIVLPLVWKTLKAQN
jgi:biotin transporter BioY